MTTITVSSKYQIVLPREAREALHIKPGTRLQVTQHKGGLKLMREPSLDEIRARLKDLSWTESEVRDESDRLAP